MRVLLLLQLPLLAFASVYPETGVADSSAVGAVGSISNITAANEAIRATAAAAIAQGQPAKMLISYKVPDQQIARQASAIMQAASITGPPSSEIISEAHRQVYSAVKARVLPAAPPGSSDTVSDATAAPQPGSTVVLVDYPHLPISLISISSAAELERLRGHPEVASVTADGIARTASQSALNLIGQPAVQAQGYTGVGTVVIIDTGLDYTRAAFGSCTGNGVPAATCKVLYTQDLATNDNQLDDIKQGFHGTNVGGVVLSVAPSARLVGLDVFEADGNAQYSSIIGAIEWAVANKAAYNITLINMSLGAAPSETACDDDDMAIAVNAAYAQGILSVVAAGNDGDSTGISAPGCASKAVSVGAVYSDRVSGGLNWPGPPCTDTSIVPDKVICFSNSASMLNVLAPGYQINGAGIILSGTSQATPMVAGSLSVLRGRFPSYTIAQLLEQLKSTGVPITDPRNGLVRPRVNLPAAVGSTVSCVPSVSPASITADQAGLTKAQSVTVDIADQSCAWTATPSDTWVRVDKTAGSGKGSLAITVDAAALVAGQTRTASVVVKASGGEASVKVTQTGTSGTTGPTMGALKGSVKRQAIQLRWSPPAVGVASYKVVSMTGSGVVPKAKCTTGVTVTAAPTVANGMLTVQLAALTPRTRYVFRVCPVDAAGNVGRGSVWSGRTSS